MPSTESSSPPRPGFLHVWLPRAALVSTVLGLAGVWAWPGDWERSNRFSTSIAIVFIVVVMLLTWLVCFSGWRWLVRLSSLLFVIAAGAIFSTQVSEVRFSGDMIPTFRFKWDPSHDDVLEAQRRSQTGAALPEVQITEEDESDSPGYRGRNRDGKIVGPPLARDWKENPPRLLWRQPIGGGYAAFAVAGNAAVTIEQRRDQEVTVCYDTLSGRERWTHAVQAHFQESMGGPGPRATPTIAGTEVYVLGATGILQCLDVATGRKVWSTEILQDNANLPWGMCGSPLVMDNLVIVNPGVQRSSAGVHALVAFDRRTGKRVWASGTAPAGYSSPVVATLAGKRQILLFHAHGLAGHDPADGKELWNYPWTTMQNIHVAQPLVLSGDRVFISSGYGVGCAMLQIKAVDGGFRAERLWQNKNMRCKFTSPVAHGGFIYGLDEGFLVCLDQGTGQRKWRDGRYGHGQILLAGDLLVILAEDGRLVLVEATPAVHRELAKINALEGKTWNNPTLARGIAYLRNDHEMAAYDLALAGEKGVEK